MKVLATLLQDMIAPRFDLTVEVLIADLEDGRIVGEPRIILLTGASGDELCALILKENISVVLCGGIEEGHYQYLTWKKIRVIDRLIGSWHSMLPELAANRLQPGTIIR